MSNFTTYNELLNVLYFFFKWLSAIINILYSFFFSSFHTGFISWDYFNLWSKLTISTYFSVTQFDNLMATDAFVSTATFPASFKVNNLFQPLSL